MIFLAPLALIVLHLVLARTRFGRLVRAATQDREMVGALGVNQARLFTAVFAIGSFLAGLGGALQIAREPADLAMDLNVLGDAFVVVVVGGMGSISGAYLAAVIIAEVKALCIGIGLVDFGLFTVNFSKLTLVAEFLVMAVVLIARPYGLLGGEQGVVRGVADAEEPLRPATPALKIAGVVALAALVLAPLLARDSPYALVLGIDILIAIVFATSLHFIMGPGGMHSFGHAAYFGLGAYAAALLVKWLAAPMLVSLVAAPVLAFLGALLFGWFAVRLSGVYLAMLTLAFAQIVWAAVFQWEGLTGGSNGVVGVWPTAPFDTRTGYFLLTLALAVASVLAAATAAVRAVRLRGCGPDAIRRARGGFRHRREAMQWLAFAMAGGICGLAGGSSRSPRGRSRPRPSTSAFGGRPGDGAARRHPPVTGPAWAPRSSPAAGHRDAADRILARAARRHHPAPGPRLPGRHRRHHCEAGVAGGESPRDRVVGTFCCQSRSAAFAPSTT